MGLTIGNNSANLERDCDHAPADFGVLFCFFGQPHPDRSILSETEDWASVSQNRILHQQTKMVIQHDTIQEHPNTSLWISWKTPTVEFWVPGGSCLAPALGRTAADAGAAAWIFTKSGNSTSRNCDLWGFMGSNEQRLVFSLCFHTEIYTAMAISDRQNPPILDMLGAPEVLKGHQRSHSVWFNKNTDTFSVLMGTLSPHSIRCLIIIFAIKLKHAILLYYIKSHGLSLVSHQHCQQFHGLSPLSQSNV